MESLMPQNTFLPWSHPVCRTVLAVPANWHTLSHLGPCLCVNTLHWSSSPWKSALTKESLVPRITFGMDQEKEGKSYHRSFMRLLLWLVLRRWNLWGRCLLSFQKRKTAVNIIKISWWFRDSGFLYITNEQDIAGREKAHANWALCPAAWASSIGWANSTV